MPEQKAEEYWGGMEDPADFAGECLSHFDDHLQGMQTSNRHERIRRSWLMYYSRSKDGSWEDDGTEIGTSGAQGELTTIKPNHYRNLIQHQLNLVTGTPPAFEVVAINSDSESLAQAMLGNGIIDYYHRVHGLAQLRVKRAETALMMGESFLHVRWDATQGKAVAVEDYEDDDGETQQREVYEGDFVFRVGTPYEVAYDVDSPDLNNPRWVMVREYVNRWDLAEQYPGYRDEILAASHAREGISGWGYVQAKSGGLDYIPVTWIYFDRNPSLPNGRMSLVLDEETVLMDGDLPYERPPVFRLAPSDIIMQPEAGGYTSNFDLLPIVEAYQASLTTILSNQSAFGVQLIASPKGTNVKPYHLSRGLSLIEYPSGETPPQPLNLLHTAPESFTFVDVLKREMETLSVINAAVRGDPEATKGDSGSKAALIHSTAQQFATGFAQQLGHSDEAIATHILFTLRDHATSQRVATIAGKYNSYASKEFSGKDLEPISRVIVHGANALKDTLQGKQELAVALRELPGGIQTADQYMMFMQTGRLDPLYEGGMAELMLIRREGEDLIDMSKPPPMVSPLDMHSQHIEEHKCKIADPSARRNPEIVKRVQDHIDWHIESLTPGTPRFAGQGRLAATGQKPFPAQQPTTPPPGQQPPGGPPGGPPPGGPQAKPPGGPQGKPPQAGGAPAMPKAPVNPTTGQRADVPVPTAPPR